ncbi:MAG TPA: c-type cytochrome biogenesis protein CcmI [Hyphomicrobiaceae bacterium]|nr:c-type cytochrome biogenesis protein CcmI [Hyphomicrobiaceae bacterium]
MLLWVLFALMTAAVLAAVLTPLMRVPAGDARADESALAVYRHQLAEVQAERARGLIDDHEAEGARLEISRRLLANAPGAQPVQAATTAPAPARLAPLALATAAVVPLLTIGIYLAHGSPGMRAFPFTAHAQVPLDQASLGDLVARVEARLRAHPEDGGGWDVIAPVYLKMQRYADAATAFANASRILGESVPRLAGFAEATVLANDGIVTDDARKAYAKIVERAPDRLEPRFWLALAKEQDGDLAGALAAYKVLLADIKADVPWRPALTQRMGEVEKRLARAGASGASAAPGPTPSQVAAAAALPPEQRGAMIAQMVDGLAQRLERDGSDLAGWQRLVHAYVVLDRKDDARSALAKARAHFSADPDALSKLAALAGTLGLGTQP